MHRYSFYNRNDSLRRTIPVSPYLKLFNSALGKLPTVRGGVWCGISNDTGKNWSRNQKITWSSISSCSSSINVIRDFLQNATKSTTFLIETSRGKRICGYTDHEHENDVILKMETSFRVQGDVLEHPKRSYHLHLVETDDLQIRIDLKDRKEIQFKRWTDSVQTVAGRYGSGKGNRIYKLNHLTDIIVDEQNSALIIALSMERASDYYNHRVMKWRRDANEGLVVAGGNGRGKYLNQLDGPEGLSVDDFGHTYIADDYNDRIVCRSEEEEVGAIIFGSNGCGEKPFQSNLPSSLSFDVQGNLYVMLIRKIIQFNDLIYFVEHYPYNKQ
ncbi:unnamed protein product [Adineta ricciae]|uniref:Uncharacterized protein n=1 Tax=Adineta ricciae TaxID=249248 RepID=A0A814X073_ADIRI|nr:unnamed protein product [Adineta ricciae]CAF1577355.1 unnamed protein product [Adineta ricciae]